MSYNNHSSLGKQLLRALLGLFTASGFGAFWIGLLLSEVLLLILGVLGMLVGLISLFSAASKAMRYRSYHSNTNRYKGYKNNRY